MKRFIPFIILAFFAWGETSSESLPVDVHTCKNLIEIDADAPPAIIYIEDGQGRKAGADPSLPISTNGHQGGWTYTGLHEIPLSKVVQVGMPRVGPPTQFSERYKTSRQIVIFDGGRANYLLHVKGMSEGVANVLVGSSVRSPSSENQAFAADNQDINFFVFQDRYRDMKVIFDPSDFDAREFLELHRIVLPGDLASDIEAANRLHLLDSGEYKVMAPQARAIKAALEKGMTNKALPFIKDFLSHFEEPKDSGNPDFDSSRDVYNLIKNPAFDILQQEAQELLDQMESGQSQLK